MDGQDKLSFTKTKDTDLQSSQLQSHLGVMPDYTYQGDGMRIDGVLDDRPAQKAGLEDGDIILKIGETSIGNIYDYMGAPTELQQGPEGHGQIKRKDQVM
ncbi:MAG: PDZ domain-containing protein [Saprospiraceae bacterium]|nr:PDZ domain-containing protein [Saprospiraceae bacterium]